MSRGVVYVVYGKAAHREATASIASLRKYHKSLPVVVIGTDPVEGAAHIAHPQKDKGGREAKIYAPYLLEWDEVLYLDADTRIHGSLMRGFDILADGWDMALTPSAKQDRMAFWQCNPAERGAIFEAVGPDAVQYQCGVMFYRREAAQAFFDVWYQEWQRFRGVDQGAFVRAFARQPIRLWLLGRPYNEGALVEHLYGKAAQ